MALPPQDLNGPGLLYVNSRISQPDIMDEKTYLTWYDDEHITEILQGDGIDTAIRSKDIKGDSVYTPYLSMYPLDDMKYLLGPAFKHITVHSKNLPGSGLCYDLADFDTRYYGLVHVYEPGQGCKGGKAKEGNVILAVEYEDVVRDDDDDGETEKWYKEEHLPQLSQIPGYLRTTRYKLAYARTNAQSRLLKGLPTDPNAPVGTAPTWLALHEFSEEVEVGKSEKGEEDLVAAAMGGVGGKKKINVVRQAIYRVKKVHGKGNLFHGR